MNTAPLWIGTLPFSYFGMPFTGSLDNVKVFNQALNGPGHCGAPDAVSYS